MRQRLAQEAARLMAEGGVRDYQAAKRKAAVRLGAPDTRNLPRNDEIELALIEYQRLFRAHTQPAQLQRLRDTAVRAMRFLQRFEPRLVGPVLHGTADTHTPVSLHVFANTPEEIGLYLDEQRIPHELRDKAVTLATGETTRLPLYCFLAQDTAVELLVFPSTGLRAAPRSPVDGGALRRATLAEVEALLADAVPL